jgi:hypothetical protein
MDCPDLVYKLLVSFALRGGILDLRDCLSDNQLISLRNPNYMSLRTADGPNNTSGLLDSFPIFRPDSSRLVYKPAGLLDYAGCVRSRQVLSPLRVYPDQRCGGTRFAPRSRFPARHPSRLPPLLLWGGGNEIRENHAVSLLIDAHRPATRWLTQSI